MAAPAAVLAAKAILAAASDKRVQTAIATVVAAVLTPFILIIVMILCVMSGAAGHNNAAASLVFSGGNVSAGLPADYQMYIEKMQGSFSELDAVLAEINGMAEGGNVDGYRVKAVFYSLFFGAEQPRMNDDDYRGFADCFVTYEEQEDEEGETYVVAAPITDMETVYGNLSALLGRGVTDEDKANAQRIYVLVKYGQTEPGGLPDQGGYRI